MNETVTKLNGYNIKTITLGTAVVGSGAAGFNTADRLWQYGQRDIAIVTEGINTGTSRNTGSDKQTYYKLSLGGAEADSVALLAQTLFSGGCVDGEHALCEAALSAQCFLRLAELGVPFPQNRYGEYVGYKTDHDPARRATSVGPYTSRRMTECLEESVKAKGIKIFDKLQAVRLFAAEQGSRALLCVDKAAKTTADCLVLFVCGNIVLATGGPAGMYKRSAYPEGHYGATGLALAAGIQGKNLTEWQFGLASLKPRWNVSGTYMQALPKFISTDENGGGAREFLPDFFRDKGSMLSMIFLKGYQWPFDVRKAANGSSIIDILVHIETQMKGRRVFLDFRQNPGNAPVDFASLVPEAADYLAKGGACFGTPIERLLHMNAPAVSFYRDKGVDLATQPLEVAVCAQHNNGGLDIDAWWQTNLVGIFAVGEAAASHGVYRPGGSALNAGQVGATRAAQYIAQCRGQAPGEAVGAVKELMPQLLAELQLINKATAATAGEMPAARMAAAARRMDSAGGPLRNAAALKAACAQLQAELAAFAQSARAENTPPALAQLFRLRETLVCQYTYLGAMLDYIEKGGQSRGSALYTDEKGSLPGDNLPEIFRFVPDSGTKADFVQISRYAENAAAYTWREVRAVPQEDDFFENVWRGYRENKNIC